MSSLFAASLNVSDVVDNLGLAISPSDLLSLLYVKMFMSLWNGDGRKS